MNKKQEALRRGLRSFIEDTSRELADLEGRPLRPPPGAPADGEAGAVGEVTDAGADLEPRALVLEDAAPAAGTAEEPGREVQVATPTAVHREERPGPVPGAPSSGHEPAVPEPPAPRHAGAPAPPAHAAKPPRRAVPGTRRGGKAPVRRRPRPAAEIWANGVSPAQVHARKGVCFAYFVNHDCWRVPDAYCNSALQVCITRECPIYRLHQDALERRFARKFRHFW